MDGVDFSIYRRRAAMLQKLSDKIRDCHERAAEAKRMAEATADPGLKADYLAMADRWVKIASFYDFNDRLTDFTQATAAMRSHSGELARADTRRDDADLLQEISISLIQEGDIDSLYERILDGAITLMSADMGGMQAFDPERNELRLLASRGFHPASAAFWSRIGLASARTACAAAFSSGRRVIVPDTEVCDFAVGSPDLDHCRLSNIRAVQSTPLVSRSGQLLA